MNQCSKKTVSLVSTHQSLKNLQTDISLNYQSPNVRSQTDFPQCMQARAFQLSEPEQLHSTINENASLQI